MAYQTFNAFNPQGTIPVMSDEEKVNVERELRGADNVFKQAMLDLEARKLAQQGSQFNTGLAFDERMQNNKFGQELKTQGSFADKNAADLARLGVINTGNERIAEIGNKVPMAQLGFDNQRYADTRADSASKRAFDEKLLGYKTSFIPTAQDAGFSAALGGGGAAPQANPADARFRQRVAESLLNLGEDPDVTRRNKQQDVLDNAILNNVNSTIPSQRAAALAQAKARGLSIAPGAFENGSGGDPERTQQFIAQPSTLVAIQQLLAHAKRGMGSVRPEIAAQDIQTGMQEITALAKQFGADPEQVKAMILQKVEQYIPETSLWSDPIRTTLGLGGALFDTSENALRKNLGF